MIKMAIRNLRYEKDEILKKKSREVDTIDEKIQTLIDDMIETMYKFNGVGLSAVQVGILKRVVVIDIDDGTGVKVLINPKITKTKGDDRKEETHLAKLRIIPLGGLGEVGKNMTAFEFGDDIVVVDCGSIFPRADMLGIDLVIIWSETGSACARI